MKTVLDTHPTPDMPEYYGDTYVKGFETQSYSRLARLLPLFNLKNTDVVGDFGCGNGMLLHLIHDRVGEYYGVDFSPQFISAAQAKAAQRGIKNAHFICADIVRYCNDIPNSLSAAFTMDFSEHIDDSVFLNIYRGIHTALKPTGSLFLHTPNGAFILEILKTRGILPQVTGHIAVRSAREYSELLKQAGFTNITIHYLPHYNFLKGLHLLSYVPVIGKYFQARIFISCQKP